MRDKIHFRTIERYFEERLNCTIAEKCFENKQTGEAYHLLCKKDSDIAFFTVKPDGSHLCIDSNGEPVDEENIFGYINGEPVSGTYGRDEYPLEKLNLQVDGKNINLSELDERGVVWDRPVPEHKDWNEDLVAQQEQEKCENFSMTM